MRIVEQLALITRAGSLEFRGSFRFSRRIWPVPVLGICETLSDINLECVGASIAQYPGHQT